MFKFSSEKDIEYTQKVWKLNLYRNIDKTSAATEAQNRKFKLQQECNDEG